MTRRGLHRPVTCIAGALLLIGTGSSPVIQKAEAAILPLGLEHTMLIEATDLPLHATPVAHRHDRPGDVAAKKSRSDQQDKALWTLLATAAFVGGIALLDAWMRRRNGRDA